MEAASQVQQPAASEADATITHTTQTEEVDNSNVAGVAAAPAGLASIAGIADSLPPPYCVRYDKNGFPSTLLDWRREPKDDYHTARHLWRPLEKVFRLHGYELFVREPSNKRYGLRPYDGHGTRAPDRFHAIISDGKEVRGYLTPHVSNKCCPATRLRDGTHVMIQLVYKAGHGARELEALRRFSRPDIAFHPDNHVVSLLDELQVADMTFAVLPLLEEGLIEPWFYTLDEALDAVDQTFKGLAFLHSNYVSHGDIGFQDILLNFGGLRGREEWFSAITEPAPFRSRLSAPCRYSFIDFEVARIFPYGSDPATHRSSGVHFIKNGRISSSADYGKDMPPEWMKAGSFCVYKSDVYQIGKLWKRYLAPLETLLAGLHGILDNMTHNDPSHRITMGEALSRFRVFMNTVDEAQLKVQIWQHRPRYPSN